VLGRHVHAFAGVFLEVVEEPEVLEQAPDQLPAPESQRALGAQALQLRHDGADLPRLPREDVAEAPPGKARRRREVQQLEQRRQQVDHADRLLNDPGGDAGTREQQRHAHDLLEQRAPVQPASVLTELLAVVRHHDDDGVLRPAALLEQGEQPSQVVVGEPNLALVEGARVLLVQRREALVGAVLVVGVEGVDPQEPGLVVAPRLEPGARLADQLG